MKKGIIILSCVIFLMNGCASEFNAVYKYGDTDVKYEFAKECFARGKYQQAVTLLEELVTIKKGSDEAQECLYMLAMAQYCNYDYEAASETFKKYCSSYPRGVYAEPAAFYVGQSLYQSAPEPRLDQSPTNGAITAYQQFIDLYPDSKLKPQAQDKLYELHDKLIQKELLSAELYYNLGGYFGNINSNEESNYTACIVTAQNALKNYPYCTEREQFMLLIMKSKFQLAENSSEEKRLDRYRDAEDECYGFINEFPESKNVETAEKYIVKCKKVIKD
ncbi:Beta-barrel assembly machine subunit BamD [Xylanibacter ruminicola]|uniref:Beta-barrel assembly machine subunit BamD n=1 Tax=Xylanibacter ruminicola TaxID=839 RepID=A0A1H5UAU5_XYLRU|nr:outer membrane protein assembly factor BamD [Xylanibacter ruminicola]SEF72235.1 Beta-barrel assembly machine subunit BamD [Xylanibacter ruminicola]